MQDLFPHADVFLYNQSGLRAPLLAGDLTVEDISQVLPFDATPFELRLTAGELTDLLRIATSGAHSGPVVRGLRVIVGPSRDPGIDNDWNGDGVRSPWERNRLVRVTHLDGTELDPQRTYVMVTNSYLGMGGSSFRHVTSQLPPERTRSLGHQPLRTLVIDWLRERPGLELGTPDDPWTQPDYKL
jgi:2',3'-cyclic-nucleotide 2'-phosphodiesterase (5'-nucleotidase family)